MTTDALPNPLSNPLREHLLLATIGALASCVVGVLPLVFGAFIDHLSFSADVTGLVTSVNVLGIAAGALLSTFLVKRWALIKVLILALATLSLADLVSSQVTDSDTLTPLRFLSGLGAGLVGGGITATISRFPQPARGFSAYMIGLFAISVVGLYALPPFIASFGIQGLFILFGIVAASTIPLLWLIRWPEQPQADSTEASPPTRLKWSPVTVALLACILFLMSGNGALWAFIERAGIEIGLASDTVGLILSFSSLCGIGGALLVAPCDRRFNSIYLMLFGACTSVTAALLLAWLGHITLFFVIGICLMSMAWTFTVPITQSLLIRSGANQDPASRSALAALSTLMYTCGLAAGPSVIGYTVSTFGSGPMAFWSCAVFYGLSLLCAILLSRSNSLRASALDYEAAA